uniref:BOS complex subunit TMEM147 n=1 Tax=Timema douglasi TaxID=61478 RepID=A0A7R8VG01_TIMDO|nr:unnamed protein product [Timema douglasi]
MSVLLLFQGPPEFVLQELSLHFLMSLDKLHSLPLGLKEEEKERGHKSGTGAVLVLIAVIKYLLVFDRLNPRLNNFRSEYGAFWKCFQAGGIYMFTQLCKMLVLATFFPASDGSDQGKIDFVAVSLLLVTMGLVSLGCESLTAVTVSLVPRFCHRTEVQVVPGRISSPILFQEFLKATVDLADLAGMYLVLMGIPGKAHAKVLTAGIGWAGAENLLSRFLLLWVGARGAEFDWIYIQKSLESNISLVHNITTVTLVWLWSRHDLNRSLLPLVTAMLLVCSYKPVLMELLIYTTTTGPWLALLVRAVFTLCLGVTTLQIYAGLAHTIGIY